jgi:hypothetical protein
MGFPRMFGAGSWPQPLGGRGGVGQAELAHLLIELATPVLAEAKQPAAEIPAAW